MEFGQKIGCSKYDKTQPWVEKWAIFELDPSKASIGQTAFTYKYFCKFWHQTMTEIRAEIKFQWLNPGDLVLLQE